MIYALGVAEILSGLSRLAQAQAKVRPYTPHSLWVAVLFCSIFLVWWATWEFRVVAWTLPQYAYLLLAPIVLYFASSLLLPQHMGDDVVDLERHFFTIRRPLMASFAVFTVVVVLDGPLLGTEPLLAPARIAHGTWFGAGVWGLVTDDRRQHLAIAIAVVVSFVALTSTRFWSLA